MLDEKCSDAVGSLSYLDEISREDRCVQKSFENLRAHSALAHLDPAVACHPKI